MILAAAGGLLPAQSPEAAAAAVAAAGLQGIAWDTDTHAPEGEPEAGRRCAAAAREHGLQVVCYDTRLRLGLRHQRPPDPGYWLEVARCCGARAIRVHAGGLPEWGSSETYRDWVAAEWRRFAEVAAVEGMCVLVGVHPETLASGAGEAVDLWRRAAAANTGLTCSCADAAALPGEVPVLWRCGRFLEDWSGLAAGLAGRTGTLGVLLDGVADEGQARQAMARMGRGPSGGA